MSGGCSSPGKDHWYLALKDGGKNLRVRVMLGLGVGLETKLFYILIYIICSLKIN